MEEDRLLRFHERLKDFLQRRLILLLNFIIVFVILILLSGGYVYYKNYKEKKAFGEYVKLIEKNADIKSYKEFIKNYGETQAGMQATILIWSKAVLNNDINLMKSEVENLKKIFPSAIKVLPQYAEAKIYEDTNNIDEALRIYNTILEKGFPVKGTIKLDLAFLQEKKNPDQALRLYQELLNEMSPDNPLRGYVEYRIYKLQRK